MIDPIGPFGIDQGRFDTRLKSYTLRCKSARAMKQDVITSFQKNDVSSDGQQEISW